MSKNDGAIKELLKTVEGQKKGLGKKPRGQWITNGVFKYGDGRDYFNINTVTDFTKLAEALGFLFSQSVNFDKACTRLDIVKEHEFKWDGYTVAEWEEDFVTRIAIVAYDKKKKKLDATTAKLNTLVSPDAKTAMEIDEIRAMLDRG